MNVTIICNGCKLVYARIFRSSENSVTASLITMWVTKRSGDSSKLYQYVAVCYMSTLRFKREKVKLFFKNHTKKQFLREDFWQTILETSIEKMALKTSYKEITVGLLVGSRKQGRLSSTNSNRHGYCQT